MNFLFYLHQYGLSGSNQTAQGFGNRDAEGPEIFERKDTRRNSKFESVTLERKKVAHHAFRPLLILYRGYENMKPIFAVFTRSKAGA